MQILVGQDIARTTRKRTLATDGSPSRRTCLPLLGWPSGSRWNSSARMVRARPAHGTLLRELVFPGQHGIGCCDGMA